MTEVMAVLLIVVTVIAIYAMWPVKARNPMYRFDHRVYTGSKHYDPVKRACHSSSRR